MKKRKLVKRKKAEARYPPSPTFDQVLASPNLCLVHYLLSSYAYYYVDAVVYTDSQFDQICKTLLNNWSKVDHPHKHLTNKDKLKQGTGFDIVFPDRIKMATWAWLKHCGKVA